MPASSTYVEWLCRDTMGGSDEQAEAGGGRCPAVRVLLFAAAAALMARAAWPGAAAGEVAAFARADVITTVVLLATYLVM